MSFELVNVIRETLGALFTIAESIEKSIESIKRSSNSISSGLDNRKIHKITDALAKFYFTPAGIRMDFENYIKHPTDENFNALENRLESNREIINNFSDFVYQDMDRGLFNLPLSEISYLFDFKSKLHIAIWDARNEIASLSGKEKQDYLEETLSSFDDFNTKLEKTIKNIISSRDYPQIT